MTNAVLMQDPLTIAQNYIARGWSPIPVVYRDKRPDAGEGWGKLRLSEQSAPEYFNRQRQNIGVILGDASGGLVDIDLDCPEARDLAPHFLPDTDAIFGRSSHPKSHYLYCADGLQTAQIKEPRTLKMLVELRSNSSTDQPSQTVFPGSTHKETGERIEWCRDGAPAKIDSDELLGAVHRLAAATILARTFPADGGRHYATLALVGVLIRSGWTQAATVEFARNVRDVVGADPKKALAQMARDAGKRLAADKTLYGLPTLVEAFGESVVDRVGELLGLKETCHAIDIDDDDFDDLDAAPAEETKSPKFTFMTPDDCAVMPSRGYIVKGMLAPGDVASIFGAPGAGKSLLGPHIGYAVAQGRAAFGLRTKPGRVWYIPVEDPSGMNQRVQALRKQYGSAPDFVQVGGVANLLAGDDLSGLMKEVKRRQPALIFIDTLAMAFPGLEENSADGMGKVVAAARRLAKYGAAVVLIHHDTKAGTPTPRGHSLLNGALDMAIQLQPRDAGGIIRGQLTKNRNGPCDLDLAFKIAVEEMGLDDDGDTITYVRVDELEAGSAPRQSKLTGAARAALDALKGLLGADVSASVSIEAWRAACVDGRGVSTSDSTESRARAFRRAMGELSRAKRIWTDESRVGLGAADHSNDNAFDDLEEDDGDDEDLIG